MISLTEIFDDCFNKNLTISTCASLVEDVTKKGRESAQQMFAEMLMDKTANKTVH